MNKFEFYVAMLGHPIWIWQELEQDWKIIEQRMFMFFLFVS